MKTRLHSAFRATLRLLVGMALPAHVALPFLVTPDGVQWYADHLTYPLAPVVLLASMAIYGLANHSRTHPPRDNRGKPRRPARPPRIALRRVVGSATDIIANLDTIVWRIIYLVTFIASMAIPAFVLPVTMDDVSDLPATATSVAISVTIPIALAGVLLLRLRAIMAGRIAWIDEMYAIARDCLGYEPLPERGTPTTRQQITATPHLAVDVVKWRSLTEGDAAFIWAPEKLSASDVKTWDELSVNLEEKMPREEEWRIVTKGQRGKGAMVGPANYPRSVLWDGDFDPDPLTFHLGVDLETSKAYKITLNDTSPHFAVSGGTSSGKTSGAEIVAAQVLMKPMPWDPSLYGQVHIVDPKGPFAQRWWGRPGVVVSNGLNDSDVEPYVYDEEGNQVCEKTGVMVMAEHLQHIESEHQRRAKILSRYSDAATWVALPDEVKRDEKFFPILVILDEFLDHTSEVKGKGPRAEMESEAREFIVGMTDWLLRKARNVGIHVIVIAQRANMKLIGDTMMTNMPIRMVTGQIDDAQLGSMFALPAKDVPRIPSTRHDPETGETKTIPGRARILQALGQSISKIQVMWFGGKLNNETLNKWLPRGDRPPNGDFSLPTGSAPRTADDFDDDGHLIGGEDNEADETPEIDNHDSDTGTDTVAAPQPQPQQAPEQTPPPEQDVPQQPQPQQAPPQPQQGTSRGKPNEQSGGPHDPAIFPAANAATEATCAACGTAAAWRCPACERRYCPDHGDRTKSPELNGAPRYLCGQCAKADPLASVGLAPVLTNLAAIINTHGLKADSDVIDDANGHYGALTVREPSRGRKIVVIYSRPATTAGHKDADDDGFSYRAQTAAGKVIGLQPALDRAHEAIAEFISRNTPDA